MKRNPLFFTENVDRDRVVGAPTRVPNAIAVIAGTYVRMFVFAVISYSIKEKKGFWACPMSRGFVENLYELCLFGDPSICRIHGLPIPKGLDILEREMSM